MDCFTSVAILGPKLLQQASQRDCFMKLLFATDENTFHLDVMGGDPCLRDSFTKKTYTFFERYTPFSLHTSPFTGRRLLHIPPVTILKGMHALF